MKKRFLTLALVAIPLLTSCGKMKEVDYTTWKATYDTAMTAKAQKKYTQIRLKGVGENGKFDSGYQNIGNPSFVGDASTAYSRIGIAQNLIGTINTYSGQGYKLFVNGKEFGYEFAALTLHFDKYAYPSYFCSDTVECNITYKK